MRKVLQTLCLLLVSCTLLLTGCGFGRFELYAGTWGTEDISLGELEIDSFTMTLTPCEEEPAWDEYDTLFADDIRYLVTFTVNGEECETVSVTYYGKEMKTTLFTWRESFLELGGQLHRISKENVFEGRIRLYEDDVDWNTVASAEVQLFPQG